METKEYFEKVMQEYNQHRNGRSLRKYCQDEGIDYKWLQEYKRSYYSIKGMISNRLVSAMRGDTDVRWMMEEGRCYI